MLIFGNRLQRENLRLDVGLQFDDQAHHAGPVAAGANQFDVGVAVENFRRQRLQHRIEFDAFEIDHQARRVGHHLAIVFERLIVFQGDPRVVGGGPHAHRQDARRRLASADFSDAGDPQRQAGGGVAEDIAAVRHATPLAPTA